jgi:hypothetical protein
LLIGLGPRLLKNDREKMKAGGMGPRSYGAFRGDDIEVGVVSTSSRTTAESISECSVE